MDTRSKICTLLLTLAVVFLVACGKTGDRRTGAESAPASEAVTATIPEQAGASGPEAAPPHTEGVSPTPAVPGAPGAAASASGDAATASGSARPTSTPAGSETSADLPASPVAPAERTRPVAEEDRVATDVPNPSISPFSGVFVSAQVVRIDHALKEARIRYTLDGSTPSSARGLEYLGPVKIEKTASLKALAYIPGGKSSEVVVASYAIGELFARPMPSVASAALGTFDSPVEGLGRALAEARARGIGIVKAQAGTYSERVDIAEDVVIKGGYSLDFAVRDLAKYASVLAGPESRGTTQSSPGYSIRFSGSAVTAKTLLEGFAVKGADASYGAAVVASDRAAPVIRSCSLAGGNGSYTYGLRSMTQASPRIEYSFIDGGDGGSSFGISADGAEVAVASCTITAGTGTAVSYGIALISSRASVAGSVIDGGNANSSYGVAAYSAPNLSLLGCTISGGRGKTAYAVFIASSDPDIRNCLLFTRGPAKAYGIYENYGDSDPKTLEGNCLFDCPSGLYYDEDTRKAYMAVGPEGQFVLPDGTAMTTPRGKANITAVPVLGPAPDLRTSPGSPEAVLRGGVALPAGFDLDRDGRKRTLPYSIGAYEVD